MEYTHDAQFLEHERDIGCAPLFAKFRTFPSREESTNFNGQRFLCSMHKFSGRNACGPVQCSHQDLEFGDQTKFNHFRQMVGREIEHNAGLFKSFRQQIQLDNSPKSISISRQNLGTSCSGQVCMHEQRTVCQVQQSLPTTSGVDAFSQTDWREENNFINAPFRLLPRILNKLDQYQTYATTIAPLFRAHPFFLRLINRSIAAPIRLLKARTFCIPMSNTLPEPLKNPKWKIYAWRVCGRRDCCPATGL